MASDRAGDEQTPPASDRRRIAQRLDPGDRDEAARRDAKVGIARGIGAEPRQDQHRRDGQHDLPKRQRQRPRRIEVEAQRLVDRDLQRGRRRPAAQRQHDR